MQLPNPVALRRHCAQHGVGLILIALCGAFTDPLAAQPPRPNIVLVTVDDLNDWVGVLGGHPQAKTPNIDRLARRGTLFTTDALAHRAAHLELDHAFRGDCDLLHRARVLGLA